MSQETMFAYYNKSSIYYILYESCDIVRWIMCYYTYYVTYLSFFFLRFDQYRKIKKNHYFNQGLHLPYLYQRARIVSSIKINPLRDYYFIRCRRMLVQLRRWSNGNLVLTCYYYLLLKKSIAVRFPMVLDRHVIASTLARCIVFSDIRLRMVHIRATFPLTRHQIYNSTYL